MGVSSSVVWGQGGIGQMSGAPFGFSGPLTVIHCLEDFEIEKDEAPKLVEFVLHASPIPLGKFQLFLGRLLFLQFSHVSLSTLSPTRE